jgi:hypothetical protein
VGEWAAASGTEFTHASIGGTTLITETISIRIHRLFLSNYRRSCTRSHSITLCKSMLGDIHIEFLLLISFLILTHELLHQICASVICPYSTKVSRSENSTGWSFSYSFWGTFTYYHNSLVNWFCQNSNHIWLRSPFSGMLIVSRKWNEEHEPMKCPHSAAPMTKKRAKKTKLEYSTFFGCVANKKLICYS